jgi:hypothetical protein
MQSSPLKTVWLTCLQSLRADQYPVRFLGYPNNPIQIRLRTGVHSAVTSRSHSHNGLLRHNYMQPKLTTQLAHVAGFRALAEVM